MATDLGPLFGRFFQLGYVTRDGEAAAAQFRKRFAPVEFDVLANTAPNPITISVKRIYLAWIGQTMVELIEVNDAVPSIYRDYLPATQSDIRLHHFGYLIDDYPATLRRLEEEGYDIPFRISYGNVNDCCYADTRAQLGHYLEYIRLGEEGRKWFSAIPGFQKLPDSQPV